MDELSPKVVPKYRPGTLIAGGILILLYICLCIVTVGIGSGHGDSVFRLNSETSIPTHTGIPTSQILVHSPENRNVIRYEGFSSNIQNWSLYYPNGKVEVINSRMILQSNLLGHPAIGYNQNFISVNEKYYVQADFTTDIEASAPYGLVFGMNDSTATFYLFYIAPGDRGHQLFKYLSGEWNELTPFSYSKSLRYPEANTLSVFYDKGNIILYINGELVSSYIDSQPLQYAGVGAYAANSGYRLIVDNFIGYSEK